MFGSEVALAALLWVTYAFFFQGGAAPQNSRFDLSLALAFEHRFTIDSFHPNTIDKAYYQGHYFSEKSPIVSYLALPVPFLAAQIFREAEIFENKTMANDLLYFATVFSVALLAALSAVFFRRLLVLINAEINPTTSYIVTLIVYGTTLLLPYSTLLMGHSVAGSLVIMGLYLGLRNKNSFSFCLGGFLLGLAAVCEYPVALLSWGAATSVILNSPDRKKLRAPFFLAGVPFLILAIHNRICFDSPWAFGYGNLRATIFHSVMSSGVYGIHAPSLKNFFQLTLGLYRGLFIYSPVLLIAVGSLFYWPPEKIYRIALPLIGSCVALALLISGYGYWQGGACFGPRHLVPCIPLLGLGFAYLPRGALRNVFFAIIVGLSTLFSLGATAITPFVSEQDTNPLFHSYFWLFRSGRVAINPVSFVDNQAETLRLWKMIEPSPPSSFNLGQRLFGLSGWTSLVPLVLVWAVGIFSIQYSLRKTDQ
jgi:hypothetical protein